MRELRERIDQRRELKKSLKVGSFEQAPWKYVIVATGNIYDDVEQAKAAAQLGADVIAVIRSTAQSLLDYVPHGATTEGFGGTYATQENFRIMREALDAESRKLVGMLSLDDLLKARVRNLEEERRRERVLRIRVPFKRPAPVVPS